MFAVLYFPRWTLQALLRHEPESWRRPLALVDPRSSTPRVIEATTSARRAGVTLGLTAPQALARCRDLVVRHRSPELEANAAEVIRQCAFSFSPHLESTADGIVTLDLRGLAALASGGGSSVESSSDRLRSWGTRLGEALSGSGWTTRIGLAATPNVARHAACRGAAFGGVTGTGVRGPVPSTGSEPNLPGWMDGLRVPEDMKDGEATFEVIVVERAAEFLAGLPVAALEPSSDVEEILNRWGIRSVGELLALGQAALAERLGLEALALWSAASATAVRPLRLAQPAENFEERHEFDPAIETLEPLLFLLRRCLDALGARLEARGQGVGRMNLRLGLESGTALERVLRVPQPTRRADVLFRMLHTHLEGMRTESPIRTVALRLEPAPTEVRQFGLFEPVLRDPHQLQETLARLVALLGAERVGTPVRESGHRTDAFGLVAPEFDRDLGPGPSTDASGDRSPAIRRFRPAQVAEIEVRIAADRPADLPSAPRRLVGATGRGWLVRVEGPVRTSGHWWENRGWEREEWDAVLPDGRVIRLAKTESNWQIEGILD